MRARKRLGTEGKSRFSALMETLGPSSAMVSQMACRVRKLSNADYGLLLGYSFSVGGDSSTYRGMLR